MFERERECKRETQRYMLAAKSGHIREREKRERDETERELERDSNKIRNIPNHKFMHAENELALLLLQDLWFLHILFH
jgi:hypothetical protein